MKASVIIPAYNEEKRLPRLLDSLEKQTFKDFEIIVSNSASTDRTLEIAKRHGCRTVTTRKLGPGHARNAGAELAGGDILVFIDADLIPDHRFMEILLKTFGDKYYSVAGLHLSPTNKILKYRILFKIGDVLLDTISKISPIGGACIIIKKSIHRTIKGFDDTLKLSEDWDYLRRASKQGKFGIIKNAYIEFSTRRIEEYGILKLTIVYVKAALHYFFLGNIKDDRFKYEFK